MRACVHASKSKRGGQVKGAVKGDSEAKDDVDLSVNNPLALDEESPWSQFYQVM